MIGIYKITSPTGKIYIGQSIDIEKRLRVYKNLNCTHQQKLYNSLKKHGIDKHNFEIIHICRCDELNKLEKYYVDLFQTFNSKHGLNLKDGGGSKGATSEETRRKQSASSMGQIMSVESRKKMSEAHKGKKQSKEHIEKLRKKRLGSKRNDETRKKMSAWVRTEEMKKKMSLSMLGKKKSIEARLKKSEYQKKIILHVETGVFYVGVEDAATYYKKYTKGYLYQVLNGTKKNKTPLMYV